MIFTIATGILSCFLDLCFNCFVLHFFSSIILFISHFDFKSNFIKKVNLCQVYHYLLLNLVTYEEDHILLLSCQSNYDIFTCCSKIVFHLLYELLLTSSL